MQRREGALCTRGGAHNSRRWPWGWCCKGEKEVGGGGYGGFDVREGNVGGFGGGSVESWPRGR